MYQLWHAICGCKYCYLEDNTKDEKTEYKAIDTLKYAVDKLKSKNIIPFNISLHGGEVTVLSKEEFRDLIKYVSEYYDKNKKIITEHVYEETIHFSNFKKIYNKYFGKYIEEEN